MRALVAVCLAAAAAGCGEQNRPQFDPAPIQVAVPGPAGGLMTAVYTDLDDGPIAAVIDTLTPRSVVDRLETPAETIPPASQSLADLTLASACSVESPVDGCTPTPRAVFPGTALIDVHPCRDGSAPCRIGPAGSELDYAAIVGADVLSRLAVRIDTTVAPPVVRLFTDQPGSNRRRCAAGESVFGTGLAGGGTLTIQGGETNFAPTRIPLNVCVGIDPDDLSDVSGADMLLLLGTGLGPSLLSESAYGRLLNSFATDDPRRPPALAELAETTFSLPSGEVAGRSVTLSALAIADQIDNRTSETRGACGEWNVRASQGENALVAREGRFDCGRTANGPACPCAPSDVPNSAATVISCLAAAAIELRPADGLPFVIVPDDLRLLQALRVELRPGVAQVDGVLGMSALANVRVDLDYPNGRVLMKCGDTDEAAPLECVNYTAINRRAATNPNATPNPVARCDP